MKRHKKVKCRKKKRHNKSTFILRLFLQDNPGKPTPEQSAVLAFMWSPAHPPTTYSYILT